MKITKTSKFVVFVTAIVFMSTQVLPAGWAAVQPNALKHNTDQEQAPTQPATGDNAPKAAPVAAAPVSGTTDFLMGGSAASATIPVPTVAATTPDANGRVTLSGTATPGAYIYYSLDNQQTWSVADSTTASGTWKREITLPNTGTTDIYVRARKGTDYSSSVSTTVTFEVPAPNANDWVTLGGTVPVPTVTATTPDANGRVTLSGTVTPGAYVYYSFDNKTWSVADSTTASGTWNREMTLPRTGTTDIYVRARKGTAYSPSVPTTVTFTVPAPTVEATAPNARGEVNLSGTAPAGYTIYYSVNGGPAVTAGVVPLSGIWTKSAIRLTTEGSNTISVYAKKSNFQSETASVNVNFNSTVPVPTLEATVPDSRGKVTISGTVTPGHIVSYSLNGQTWLTADISTDDGAWIKVITLPAAGITTIYVRATDTVAHRSSAIVTREVTFTVAAPTVTATAPTAEGKVTLSGTVTPGQIVQYSLDGETWHFAGYSDDGIWGKEITLLVTGTTTIRTRTKLNSQNFYSESVLTPVTFTIPAPVVNASVPTDLGKVTLSGTGPAGYTIYYSVNGGDVIAAGIVPASGNWTRPGILLPNVGSNTISVFAKKGTFQSESASVNINFNPIASVPTVETTGPDAFGKVTLSGTAAPGLVLQYSLDGENWMGGGVVHADGTWSRSLNLRATGATTILVRAKIPNYSIYSESVSKVVTFNVPVPTVTPTTPDPNGRVVLSGTVTAGQTVQYSFDGVKWLTADYSTSTGAWSSSRIMLPAVGATTIYTRSKLRYGNLYSESVPTIVTFTVPAPTVAPIMPDADRYVTLSGTATAHRQVQYSLNNGATWLIADYSTSDGVWSKRIKLPVGITSISFRARVSGGNLYSEVVTQTVA